MFCDCKILQKEPTFNFSQVDENDNGPALFSLPKEILARLGIFVATGPAGIKDAFSWGSVSVLTHLLFHKDNLSKIFEEAQADKALEKVWTKVPDWCRFLEHIEHEGYGGSWGGGRPKTAKEIRCWFDLFTTNIQKTKITELYLEKLDLVTLPPELASFSELTSVDLSHNLLSSIPPVLSKCTKLWNVIFDHNNIKEIPDWLGEHPKLFWVQLLHNPVSEMDAASLPEKLRKIVVLKYQNSEI